MKEKDSMNKMGVMPVNKLMLTMGIPMILSMMEPVSEPRRGWQRAWDRATRKKPARWQEMRFFWPRLFMWCF